MSWSWLLPLCDNQQTMFTKNDRQPLLEDDVLVFGDHDLASLLVQLLIVPVRIQLRQ